MEFISGENYFYKDQEVIQVRCTPLWLTLFTNLFQSQIKEIPNPYQNTFIDPLVKMAVYLDLITVTFFAVQKVSFFFKL